MKKFLAAIGILAICFSASAQFKNTTPPNKGLATTNVFTLTTTATQVLPNIFPVGDKGFAVWPYFVGTNSGTANLAVQVYLSADGTNFTSSPVQVSTVAMNGTTPVLGYIYVPPTTIGNAVFAKLSITNAHTASVTVSNVVYTTW